MDLYEVAVIGAGPAGSMAARYAAKEGAKTLLLEEHPAVGWPVECAGLLGLGAMAEAELPGRSFVLGEMRGAAIFSPAGNRLDFRAQAPRAYVVDRRLFDRAAACEALRAGAEMRLCSPVRRIKRVGDESILSLAGGEEIRASIVISAEGVRGRLARQAGIMSPEVVLSGAQVEVPFAVENTGSVEVHLGVAPGLFAWVIPTGEETARIGLCARERGCEHLKRFLGQERIRKMVQGSATAINVGGLPLGPPPATVAQGFLAVGDAAGQVKPTSGGGIYPGLVAAKIAGGVAAAAALECDGSALRLQEYDRIWRANLGRELEVGMRANRMLNRMSAKECDGLVSYLAAKPALIKTIEEHGDIDRPSRLMMKMLRHLDWDGLKLAGLLRYALG